MVKVQKTADEFQKHLREQVGFLQRSADAFDLGYEDEAVRLATTIRVLCHDTAKSHSLLAQLEIKDKTDFIDSAFPYDRANQLSHSGLVQIALRDDGSEPRAFLDGGLPPRKVPFDQWWNGIAFVDAQKTEFSRQDLVLALANKEGGAHVDRELDEDYARLSRFNSLAVFDVRPPSKPVPAANQVPAAVRQIAHELLKALVPAYEKQPVKKPDDGAYVMAQGCYPGLSAPKPFPGSNPVKTTRKPKVGRNAKCPCGSGKKFKKCCGK